MILQHYFNKKIKIRLSKKIVGTPYFLVKDKSSNIIVVDSLSLQNYYS